MKKIGSLLFHRVVLTGLGILAQLVILFLMMDRFGQ